MAQKIELVIWLFTGLNDKNIYSYLLSSAVHYPDVLTGMYCGGGGGGGGVLYEYEAQKRFKRA